MASAQFGQFSEPTRNWIEDFHHENGQYQCVCCVCKNVFIGHKRRVVCKECADADSYKESHVA